MFFAVLEDRCELVGRFGAKKKVSISFGGIPTLWGMVLSGFIRDIPIIGPICRFACCCFLSCSLINCYRLILKHLPDQVVSSLSYHLSFFKECLIAGAVTEGGGV